MICTLLPILEKSNREALQQAPRPLDGMEALPSGPTHVRHSSRWRRHFSPCCLPANQGTNGAIVFAAHSNASSLNMAALCWAPASG